MWIHNAWHRLEADEGRWRLAYYIHNTLLYIYSTF